MAQIANGKRDQNFKEHPFGLPANNTYLSQFLSPLTANPDLASIFIMSRRAGDASESDSSSPHGPGRGPGKGLDRPRYDIGFTGFGTHWLPGPAGELAQAMAAKGKGARSQGKEGLAARESWPSRGEGQGKGARSQGKGKDQDEGKGGKGKAKGGTGKAEGKGPSRSNPY